MSELSPETEELLNHGREGAPMSRAHRDEIKGAVLAKLATGAIVTSSSKAAAWTVTTKVIGVAAIAAVVSAGSVGVVKYQRARASQNTSTASTIANAPAPISPATSSSATLAATSMNVVVANEAPQTSPQIQAPTPLANPTVVAANPPTSGNAVNSPAIVTAPSNASTVNSPENSSANDLATSPNAATPIAAMPHKSSLAEDNALIVAAHDAIAAGDPARALQLLDQDAARSPNSALEPERSAERVFAYCAENNTAYARAAAGSFLSAHPTGPLSARVRSSCGGR
jgi:hypothetical protein